MGNRSNKQKIISLQRKLEKLEEQRAVEEARTREGVAAGLTLPAIGKLSFFSTRDQKLIGKNLSDYVDESIERFLDDKTVKAKDMATDTNIIDDEKREVPSKDQLKVKFMFEGEIPGYRIIDNDVVGRFIPAEQDVENILLTSYLQGVTKER